MPERAVRGVTLRYEIIGDDGPAIAINPGARRPYDELVGLSRRIADHGYRVLLHDRRNCGRSQLAIEPGGSEHEIWADDLYHLCNDLDLAPVFVGGASAGARLALLFALRHPDAVRGLLLWRVTGGHHAATTLADEYYGQYIALANSGGMAAICASPHFAECIRHRPKGRDELMQIDVKLFVQVMETWRQAFIRSASLPVIGATEDQLRSLTVPICLIPGNDRIHDPAAARKIAALAPQATLYEGVVEDRPDGKLKEHWDPDEWHAAEPKLAAIFADFVKAQYSRPLDFAPRAESGCR